MVTLVRGIMQPQKNTAGAVRQGIMRPEGQGEKEGESKRENLVISFWLSKIPLYLLKLDPLRWFCTLTINSTLISPA
jgi:hypothetical protein